MAAQDALSLDQGLPDDERTYVDRIGAGRFDGGDGKVPAERVAKATESV